MKKKILWLVLLLGSYLSSIGAVFLFYSTIGTSASLVSLALVALAGVLFGLSAGIIAGVNNELEQTNEDMPTQDQKTLEAILKEERDRARAIVASMGDGLFVLSKDYTFVLINPVAEKLLEVSESEVIGKSYEEALSFLAAGKRLSLEESPVWKTLTTDEAVTKTIDDDYYFETRFGKQFPVSIATAPLHGDGISGVVVVFRDSTHEKNEQAHIQRLVNERTMELRKAQAQLASSIESLRSGFIMIDMQRGIVSINGSAKLLLQANGPSNGEIEKKSPAVEQWSFASICEKFGKEFDLDFAVQECLDKMKPVDTKDVQFGTKYFHMFLAPVILFEDHTITPLGVVVIIEDTTAAKLLERTRDEFFSIASHELRTPLTAIRGNSALIQQYFSDALKDQALKEMVDDIHASSVRLIEIVNDFLDTSRLELKKITFTKETFKLDELINDVIKEFEQQCQAKNVFITLDKKEPSFPILADRNRTRQVLVNLIGNALKFTEHGGVTLSGKNFPEYVKVFVQDTGKGIPQENQELLFRKFQQAGSGILTRDATQGTGLGLYISKLLIEGMQGSIQLEDSTPGRGTTFSFTLPRSLEEASSIAPATQAV